MTDTSALLEKARSRRDELVSLRRDLHRHPELGFQEHRTASVVAEALEEAGCRVRTGVGVTGVVGEVGGGSGPVVALRADMDALPIQETADHGYASTVPGVMHACGHDAHTAILVETARLLASLDEAGELPPGTVRFLFQPSEEGTDAEGKSGARRMMEDGALEGVEAAVGLHVGGHLPAGKVFLGPGAVMAGSGEIAVEVRGRSAHAALPEAGVDALVLAAQGVVAAQQAVSRRINPMQSGVVTFGTIHGGTAVNVLADRVTLGGTLRYFDPEVRRRLVEAVEGAFGGLRAQGAEVEVSVNEGYPPLLNDPEVTEVVRRVALEVVGPDGVLPMHPFMGAEDFAFMAREVPAAFFWLGAALDDPRDHHHPTFDIQEDVLPLGVGILVQAARALLERQGA